MEALNSYPSNPQPFSDDPFYFLFSDLLALISDLLALIQFKKIQKFINFILKVVGS